MTIDLQDSKDPKIKLNNDPEKKCGRVFFDGAAKSTATGPELHEYKLDLELFGEIDADESKISRKDRSVVLVIAKKEQGHWDRLLKTSGRMPNIKVTGKCSSRKSVHMQRPASSKPWAGSPRHMRLG